jgi:hypothetical protein
LKKKPREKKTKYLLTAVATQKSKTKTPCPGIHKHATTQQLELQPPEEHEIRFQKWHLDLDHYHPRIQYDPTRNYTKKNRKKQIPAIKYPILNPEERKPSPSPLHRYHLPSPSIPSTPKELLGHRGSDSSPFWTLKIATGRADVEEDDNATILRTRPAIISQNREAHPTTNQQKNKAVCKSTYREPNYDFRFHLTLGHPLALFAHRRTRLSGRTLATGKLLGPVARSSSTLKVPPYPRRRQYVQYH